MLRMLSCSLVDACAAQEQMIAKARQSEARTSDSQTGQVELLMFSETAGHWAIAGPSLLPHCPMHMYAIKTISSPLKTARRY